MQCIALPKKNRTFFPFFGMLGDLEILKYGISYVSQSLVNLLLHFGYSVFSLPDIDRTVAVVIAA